MCLSWKLLRTPSAGDALESFSFGDCNTIDHLILTEDRTDSYRFFEQPFTEIDFLRNAPAIDLDFHQVGLLLLKRGLADLRMGKHTDDGAVFLDALQLTGDGCAGVFSVLFGIFSECLFLGFVPVFVEAAFYFVREMLGPDGGERAETAGGFDVADEADNDHLVFQLVQCRWSD